MRAPLRYTDGGEPLCQRCDERPAVAEIPEHDPPLLCPRCLDHAMGKPEPPTDAEIDRSLRRMEHLFGKDFLEGQEP